MFLVVDRRDFTLVGGANASEDEALATIARLQARDAGANFAGPAPDYAVVEVPED
jgi:hypothetical protein